MSLAEYLKSVFYPPSCAVCRKIITDNDKGPFCFDCECDLSALSSAACSDCGLPTKECRCVPRVLSMAGVLFHVKLYGYSAKDRESPANRLVYRMKSSQRRSLYKSLANSLETNALGAISDACAAYSLTPMISYVPRSRSSVNQYGFDQAELLARALSERLGIPQVTAVRRKNPNDAEMKKQPFSKRFSLGSGMFEVCSGCGAGKDTLLVIVDDVVTSGASVYWTVKAAQSLGVRYFAVISVARAY